MSLQRIAALALLAASALHAQSFGVQVGADAPLGDLKKDTSKDPKLTAGAFLFLDEYDGHVLKPRVDFTRSFEQTGYQEAGAGKGQALKVQTFSVGLDYNFYFSEKGGEGWYFLLGGQLNEARSTWSQTAQTLKANRLSGAFSAGLGCVVVPHVGFEVRFTGGGKYTNWTPDGTGAWMENRASMSGVSAGVMLLF